MKNEYDFSNGRKNPYAKTLKKQQITINLDSNIIEYFKHQSEENGIGYQTLINLYLSNCVEEKLQFRPNWVKPNEGKVTSSRL